MHYHAAMVASSCVTSHPPTYVNHRRADWSCSGRFFEIWRCFFFSFQRGSLHLDACSCSHLIIQMNGLRTIVPWFVMLLNVYDYMYDVFYLNSNANLNIWWCLKSHFDMISMLGWIDFEYECFSIQVLYYFLSLCSALSNWLDYGP